MPDLQDGESCEMQGSASRPYVLKNVAGVYSCSCPAWRNQSLSIDRRTCKHLRRLRGDAAEEARIGSTLTRTPTTENDEPKHAPALLLAESWNNALDPTDWWISEKLDGVRAFWTGKQFLSRQGNIYYAPDWFTEGLPDTPLDGELWLDRKKFQRAVSIARRQDKSEHWKELRFLVFDAPAIKDPFERRLQAIAELLADKKLPYVQAHEHIRCKNTEHLKSELARIEALGGEGLMLREPGSLYVAGRSSTLLKVKTFHDAEATVIGHQPGAGRHKGRLGALSVKLANGTEFSVGTGFSDRERENPPPVGSVVTFRYQELSDAGVPRFPSYVGVRQDLSPTPSSPAKSPSQNQSPSPTKGTVMATTATSGKTRRFEFVEGNSAKFWEVTVKGKDTLVRFGRIGTTGQSSTKSFKDEAAASAFVDKMIGEKLEKGYVEKS